jgi:transcriptional regulator with GAF, ATPase, and Fis domain
MVRGLFIIFLSLLGIFVHPFPTGIIDFIYRLAVFAVICYLIYTAQKPSFKAQQDIAKSEQKRKVNYLEDEYKEDFVFADLLSSDERITRFIKDQFDIIAEIIFPDHGFVFYKFSADKIKLFYHRSYNDYTYEPDSDLFSLSGLVKILDEKNALIIENNLNNEKNLINYISDAKYVAASFLGITVAVVEDQKLFFVYDSHNKDNFNQEDRTLIEKIRSSIQIVLLNRLKAYSLYTDLRSNESLLKFALELNSCKTIPNAIEKLAGKVSEEFEATRLTVCTVRPNTNVAVIKKVIGQENDFKQDVEFPLDEGLTGWVISKNKPYIIDDLEKGEYFIPRYNKDEKSNYGFRSFLGIPIKFEEKIFGAITLEHHITQKYGEREKVNLQRYVDIFSTTFLRNY